MGMKKINNKWSSAQLNMSAYNYYFKYLRMLAISRIEWEGMPKTVDTRFLEVGLFEAGRMCFFVDNVIDVALCLRYTDGQRRTVYNQPANVMAFGMNNYRKDLNISECALIFNNMEMTNDVEIADMYARKLANIDRTIDINVHGQKTPVALVTTQNQRLSIENIYKDYAGNAPVIITDKSIDVDNLNVLQTVSPYVSDKLSILRSAIFNQYLTYLGIENANQDKRERMVSDEVEGNKGSIEISRYMALNPRREACEKIKELFGFNVDVHFRSNMDTVVNRASRQMFLDTGDSGYVDSSAGNAGGENG